MRLQPPVVDNTQPIAEILFEMSVTFASEAKLYFHFMILLSEDVVRKKPNIMRAAVNDALPQMAF